MKRIIKRSLSVLIMLALLLSAVPISYVAQATAASLGYVVGDVIEFGSYPQSKVTDSAIISQLENKELNWISYDYCSGNGEFGSMASSDYMKYADVELDGEKYRAVKFEMYRPNLSYHLSSAENSNQDDNGYNAEVVYWFKFDRLKWRVINADEGLIMSESLIDSQAYNDTVYYHDNGNDIGFDDYYLDSTHKKYANDYENVSIREWLNDDFYNTAFSVEDKEKILTYKSDNSAINSKYNSGSTRDYVFIPSYDNITNADLGFASDTDRTAIGTDYAMSQGLYVPESGESAFWWLRTPGEYSYYACRVSNTGEVNNAGNSVDFCNYGVRPVIRYDFDGMGERYTATFMVDGEVYDEKSYAIGENIVEPDVPEKFGYIFKGWDTSVPETMSYENLVFNATWTAISSTVYFMDSEGNQIDCVTGSYGSRINAIDATKTGYMFEGWYYSDGTPALFPVTLGTEDIYVYAYYSIANYTVCFNADGGRFSDGTTLKTVVTAYGSTIMLPEAPSRIGYTFVGWNEPAAMPAQDITLTAKWQVNAYNAVFDANGGVFSDGSTKKEIEADFGAEIIAPENPTRENYVFVGWEPVVGTMDAEGKTFVANWEYSVYKLTYLDSDGNIFAEYDVAYGSELPVPEESPAKEFYTFTCWTDIPEVMPAADIVIRPVFERVPVKLSTKEDSNYIIDYENMAILGVAEYTEFRRAFTHHFVVEGDGYIDVTRASSESRYAGTGTVVSLYDNVTGENIGDFTVVVAGDLDGDGVRTGTDGKMINDESLMLTNWSSETIYDSEKGEMIPNPEYNFYRFLAADANKDGKVDFIDFHANGFKMYTVYKYVMNTEGNYEADEEFYYEDYGIVGETVTYTPDEASEGFYIDTTNSVLSGTFGETDLEFVVYYAREKYTFTTVVDGYENSTEYLYEQAIEIAEPEKEGYTFSGWNMEIPETMPAQNITVYATFDANIYQLTFDANGGSFADGSSSVVKYPCFGYGIESPEPPEKTGYIFAGWVCDDNYYDEYFIGFMPAKDLTFTAKWETVSNVNYRVEYYFMDTDGLYSSEPSKVEQRTGITDEVATIVPGTYEGFTLDESESVLSRKVSPDGTTVLKLYYARNIHTVTFIVDGMPVSELNYYYGSILIEPESPQKEGHDFIGWVNTDSTEICAFPITVEGDLSFMATLTIAKHEVTFDANGGSWSDGDTTKVVFAEYGTEVDAPEEEPTREGYIFSGWQDANSNAVSLPIIMPDENITLYPIWENDLCFCRVRNVSRISNNIYKEMNATYEITVLDGCSMVEFLTEKSGEYIRETVFYKTSENVSVVCYDDGYEVWTIVASLAEGEYKVRVNVDGTDEGWEEANLAYDYYVAYDDVPFDLMLDANGGYFPENSTGLISIYYLLYGESIEDYYEEPVRAGFIFDGWQDKDGNTVEINGTMPDVNGTVYAQWKEKPVVGGTALEIRTEIFREVNGEWVQTDKVLAGEHVKARVYIDTDYRAGYGQILLFYNSNFFEDSYSVNLIDSLVMNSSPTSTPAMYGLYGEMIRADSSNGNIRMLIEEGYITDEFADEHSAIMFRYQFPDNADCQILNGDEWFAEFDLKVKDNATGTGNIFVSEDTIASWENFTAYISVSKQSEYSSLASEAVGMYDWYEGDADVTLFSNPVTIYENFVTVTFVTEVVPFSDGSWEFICEGDAGTPLNVEHLNFDSTAFVLNWHSDGMVTNVDKFPEEDTTYYAIWEEVPAQESWFEFDYDVTTGELVITGEGELYATDSLDELRPDIKSVVINDGITTIGDYTFMNCTSLTKITFANTVTAIGDSSFAGCYSLTDGGLTSIVIPDSVKTIGNDAFYGCYNLEYVTIGSGVISIGESAFGVCLNLDDVYYAGTEEDWNEITIGSDNNPLKSARIHFESSGEDANVLNTNSLFSLLRNTSTTSNIEMFNIADAEFYLEYTDAYYLGQALKPVVYLQHGDELFDAKKELKIIYVDNNKVGTAKVILEGLNRFSGSAELEFAISYEHIPEQIVNVVATGEINKISLSWGISSETNTKSYNIYRRDESSDEYSLIKTVNSRDNVSYTDTSAEKGKTYFYYVTAVSPYGAESIPSDEVFATVLTDVQAPKITKFMPSSGTTIKSVINLNVTAEDNVGVIKVVYNYSVDGGANWTRIGEGFVNKFEREFDTTILKTTSVKIMAVAYDAENNASEAIINDYVVDNTAPEKVTGLSATVQPTIIVLSWNNVSDADVSHYILQQKINNNWKTIRSNLKNCTANIGNLETDTEYSFRVACVDKIGNVGEYSDELVVRSAKDPFEEDVNYGLAHFTVVDATTRKPVSSANLTISIGETEYRLKVDESGKVSQYLPVGEVRISVVASGYLSRNLSYTIKSGEQQIPTIGISNKPLVETEITSERMDYDEIIDAGIDVNDPENNHVYKYEVILTFTAGLEYFDFNFNYYWDDTEKKDVTPDIDINFGEDDDDDDDIEITKSGSGYSGKLPNGTKVTVFPSERFLLIVYGEVKWLKEMFDVEMVVFNSSLIDTAQDCVAELKLPNGLSLAGMTGEPQSKVHNFGTLYSGEKKSHHWYVRGDKPGLYDLTASLKGTLMPFREDFEYSYTAPSPIKVYAGDALYMNIIVPDACYSYDLFKNLDLEDYDDRYPIRIEIENVSDMPIYNLEHKITGLTQKKVTTYHMLMEGEYSYQIGEREYINEWYDDDFVFGVQTLNPGEKLVLELETNIEFFSSLEYLVSGNEKLKKGLNIFSIVKFFKKLSDPTGITGALSLSSKFLSLFNLEYSLSSSVVHTLEGSTTSIPYGFTIVNVARPSIYLNLTNNFVYDILDWRFDLDENVLDTLGMSEKEDLTDKETLIKKYTEKAIHASSGDLGVTVAAWVESGDSLYDLQGNMLDIWVGPELYDEDCLRDLLDELFVDWVNGELDDNLWDLLINGEEVYIPITKEQHYERNKYNIDGVIPQTMEEAQNSSFWRLLPDSESACHQFTAPDGEKNYKFVSIDGTYEAVYSPDGKLITDPRDVGTYNYCPHDKSVSGHIMYDYVPWVIWGNSPDDTTTFEERVKYSAAGLLSKEISSQSYDSSNEITKEDIEYLMTLTPAEPSENNYSEQMFITQNAIAAIENYEKHILSSENIDSADCELLRTLADEKIALYGELTETWLEVETINNENIEESQKVVDEFNEKLSSTSEQYLEYLDILETGDTDRLEGLESPFTIEGTNENAVLENGVLTYPGSGDIIIKSNGFGKATLCVDLGDGEIIRMPVATVEDHKCDGEWKFLIEPTDEYYGYMVKYCDVCNELLNIDFPEVGKPIVTDISVNKTGCDDIYEIGEVFNPAGLELVVSYSDGTSEIVDEGYTIDNVSFEEPGEHTIKISYNGESDYIDVWVNPPISEAEISLKKAELTENNYLKLSIFNLPKDMNASDLNWTSSDESVVTVTNGIVSAKSAGTAIITVSDKSGQFTAECEITVKELESYTIRWIINGETIEQTVKVKSAITEPEVTAKQGYKFVGWTPSVPETMPANDLTFTAVFEETPEIPETLEVVATIRTPSRTTINYGDSIWIHADVENLPAGAKIIWTPSNNNFEVVEVSADGLSCKITPKSSGTTTFTASVVDENDNILGTDTQDMTAKAGLWQKIVAFFKKLFGATKTYPELYKSLF